MAVDMGLALTYKPVLMLSVKSFAILIIHHCSMSFLHVIERYLLFFALFFAESFLVAEFIFDTKLCMYWVSFALLMQDLYVSNTLDYGTYDSLVRIHSSVLKEILLMTWVVLNCASILFVTTVVPREPSYEIHEGGGLETDEGVSDALHGGHDTERVVVNGLPFIEGCVQPLQYRDTGWFEHHATTLQTFEVLLHTVLFVIFFNVGPTQARPGQGDHVVLANDSTNPGEVLLQFYKVIAFTCLSSVWTLRVRYTALTYGTVAGFHPCIMKFGAVMFCSSFVESTLIIALCTAMLILRILRSDNQLSMISSTPRSHTSSDDEDNCSAVYPPDSSMPSYQLKQRANASASPYLPLPLKQTQGGMGRGSAAEYAMQYAIQDKTRARTGGDKSRLNMEYTHSARPVESRNTTTPVPTPYIAGGHRPGPVQNGNVRACEASANTSLPEMNTEVQEMLFKEALQQKHQDRTAPTTSENKTTLPQTRNLDRVQMKHNSHGVVPKIRVSGGSTDLRAGGKGMVDIEHTERV